MTATATLPMYTLRRALASTLPCASTDATLPLIAAVHLVIQEDTVKVMATDRYTVARYVATEHVETDNTAEATINAKDAKALIAAIPKENRTNRGYEATVHVEDEHISVTFPGVTLTYKTVEGTYPPIEKLLTDNDARPDERPVGFNTRLLAQLDKCTRGLGGINTHIVAFAFSSGDKSNVKPVQLTVPTAPEWTGLIMPARI